MNNKKRVLVILDTKNKNFLIAKKIISLLFPQEVTLVFYIGNKNFSIEGKIYNNINKFIFKEDIVINLLPVFDDPFIRDIYKKIKFLSKDNLFESIDKKILFSSKNNIKHILKNRKIQTPVFQLLGIRNPEETFLTFTQPSRIFSKKNNFYSEKINSVDEMRSVFKKVDKNKKSDYLIEEYVEGQDIYAFVFKYDNKIISYSILRIKKNKKIEYIKLDKNLDNEVKESSISFFENFAFEKFILLHLKKHPQRGIYFLNAFIDHSMLGKKKYEIISEIFLNQGLDFKTFLQKNLF